MQLKKIFFVLSLLLVIISVNVHGEEMINDNVDTVRVNADNGDKIKDMVLQSIALIGIPYKWGGNTPDSGLDCSGFVRYVYQKSLGITLPRTAADMANLGRNIHLNQLEPGDLLFFNTLGGKRISHTGIYLGNNKFIQAPRTGKSIEITEFNSYYHSKFIVAKRIVQKEINSDGIVTLNDVRSERDTFIMRNKKEKKYLKPKTRKKVKSRKMHSGHN